LLIDRVLKEGLTAWKKAHLEHLFLLLSGAEVVLADNIACYYFCESPQEEWNLETDFPNVAPPFPVLWIEYTMPAYSWSTETGRIETDRDIKKVASLLISQEVGEMPSSPGISEHLKRESIRWATTAFAIVELRDGRICIPTLCVSWFVAEDGKLLRPGGVHAIILLNETLIRLHNEGDAQVRENLVDSAVIFHTALLTLSFMHCKNVGLTSVKRSEQMSANRLKRGHPALAVYKILEINPMKRILSTDGYISQVGLKKALHICRGHFKDFSIGKGLFGAKHGIYWWNMAVRGNAVSGVVLKDYNVLPSLPSEKK